MSLLAALFRGRTLTDDVFLRARLRGSGLTEEVFLRTLRSRDKDLESLRPLLTGVTLRGRDLLRGAGDLEALEYESDLLGVSDRDIDLVGLLPRCKVLPSLTRSGVTESERLLLRARLLRGGVLDRDRDLEYDDPVYDE